MPKATFQWKGDQWLAKFESELTARMKGAGAELRRETVKSIGKAFRGAGDVVRYVPKRKGTPSKPGEPPRADLGGLRQSVFAETTKDRVKKLIVTIVGVTVEYGLALELGNKKGTLKARPYLRPAFRKLWPALRAKILAKMNL